MSASRIVVSFLACALLAACGSGKLAFVLCPSDVHEALVRESDLGRQRELLYPLDYMVVAVGRTQGRVAPLAHYGWTHTTALPIQPSVVDFATPTHVSDYFAIVPSGELGIAVRDLKETRYRVQWLTEAEVGEVRSTGVLHLRPIDELPFLDPQSIR